MEYRRCSLVLVRYKLAACSAAELVVAVVAAVALAVSAGSAAWLVVAGPIRLEIAATDAISDHLACH